MKRNSRFAVGLALCLFALVLAAAGQQKPGSTPQQKTPAKPEMKGIADIPFEFYTLDTRMPAGQYSVRTVGPTHLLIRNRKDHGIAAEIYTSLDPGDPVENKDAKLAFIEREGKNYLVGIINADGRQRITGLYGMSPKEGDIRKQIALVYK